MSAQGAAAVPAPLKPRPVRRRIRREWPLRLASIAVVLAAWELYAPHVSPILLKPPSAIALAFVDLLRDGTLLAALLESLHNLVIGFAIALVLGILIGIASARWWVVENATNPWVNALYSTPSVALVPFLTLWLGYGDKAKVASIALFALFPVLINTQQGVRHVDPGLIEVARSFSSSERRMWTDVLLPSALPYILTGIRLGIGRALVGMVIAEFLVSYSGGLGSLIIQYQNNFKVARMFVPVIVVAFLGIVLIGAVSWLERIVAPWARRET
jgi:NitT/TauT family transport system permease protein